MMTMILLVVVLGVEIAADLDGARAVFIFGAQLSKTHDVYALDFLGQGKSWPTRTPSRDDGLCYSVDTWTEQVKYVFKSVYSV